MLVNMSGQILIIDIYKPKEMGLYIYVLMVSWKSLTMCHKLIVDCIQNLLKMVMITYCAKLW